MLLLTNGCSFTEGYDLPSLTDSWPFVVGNLLNLQIKNLAVGGASNDRIYRTTIEYLNIHPKPDIVIIGWTRFCRNELTSSQGVYLRILPNDCITEPHRVDDIDDDKILRFWAENLYNDYINYRQWLNYVLHLQDYFSCKKISYKFFSALEDNLISDFRSENLRALELADKSWQWRDRSKYRPFSDIHVEYQELKAMIKRVDLSRWILHNDITMKDHLLSLGYETDHTGHFQHDGHKRWADVIADEIRCLI